ncbi:DUF1566 domain-containing protein [Desulfococcaceae bacterium HSG7]|nr:DUF1566 domain-containing protein [Desulfococcaceae bacterium HSG7]
MWASKDNGYDINWNNAKRYCESYKDGGHSDWRMPTINELASIYDKSKNNRYGYHVSPLIGISESCLWSSELRGSKAARFDFHIGSHHWARKLLNKFSRILPVRGRLNVSYKGN